MATTVLIIDDDEMLRGAMAHGLRGEGFVVLDAPSAEQAAEILDRVTVDAIVLDRMMGGMDGLTFLKNMRAAGRTTPTIMLTAMTGPENAIAGLSNGADDYLAKPFQLRELVLRIKNMTRARGGAPRQMPHGLIFTDDEFFVPGEPGDAPRLLSLSGEEKKLLLGLTGPVGNVIAAQPMVAKRLRMKLNSVLSDMDIITIRGRGYKMVTRAPQTDTEPEER